MGTIRGGVVSALPLPTVSEQNALPRRPPAFALWVRTSPDSTVREPRTQR
jgi:hypothetical protein